MGTGPYTGPAAGPSLGCQLLLERLHLVLQLQVAKRYLGFEVGVGISQLLGRYFLVLNVGARVKPHREVPRCVAPRPGLAQKPAVRAVSRLEAVLEQFSG